MKGEIPMSERLQIIADILAIARPVVELVEKVKARHQKDDEHKN